MHDFKENIKVNRGSNKSFGIVFGCVFLIVFAYLYVYHNSINLLILVISLIFFFIALTIQYVLSPLNKLWFRFGLLLGKIISPLILSIIYFFVFMPANIITSLLRKDLLKKKYNSKLDSYWIKRENDESSMKKRF